MVSSGDIRSEAVVDLSHVASLDVPVNSSFSPLSWWRPVLPLLFTSFKAIIILVCFLSKAIRALSYYFLGIGGYLQGTTADNRLSEHVNISEHRKIECQGSPGHSLHESMQFMAGQSCTEDILTML